MDRLSIKAIWLKLARRWTAALAVASLVGFGLLVFAEPAQAVGIECGTAPTAASPSSGLAGMLSSPPPKGTVVDDPFAKDSTSSIMDVYGVAGVSWFTFQDGCVGVDGVTDGPAIMSDGIANLLMLPAILTAAGTASAANMMGDPSRLGFLDPVIASLTQALNEAFTSPLMPLFILLAAIGAAGLAAKGQVSRGLRVVAFVLLGLSVVGLTVGYPLKAASVSDQAVSSTVSGITTRVVTGHPPTPESSALPASAMVGTLYKSLVWQTWLRGQLGSATSATATTYGPELFKSMALTWEESAQIEADPKAAKTIYAKHEAAFRDVANKIKEADPAAYEYLTRPVPAQRYGLAVAGSLMTVIGFAVPFMAFVMLLLCFLLFRIVVVTGPALGAVITLFPPVARETGRKLASAVINTLMFSTTAAVYVVLADAMVSSNQAMWLQCIELIILTVLLWSLMHPVHSLGRFTSISKPGIDGNAARQGMSHFLDHFVTRKTVQDAAEDSERPRAGGVSTGPTSGPIGISLDGQTSSTGTAAVTHQWSDQRNAKIPVARAATDQQAHEPLRVVNISSQSTHAPNHSPGLNSGLDVDFRTPAAIDGKTVRALPSSDQAALGHSSGQWLVYDAETGSFRTHGQAHHVDGAA